jgi:hypothetical protein
VWNRVVREDSKRRRRDPRRKTPPPALRVPLPLGGGEKLAEAGGAACQKWQRPRQNTLG